MHKCPDDSRTKAAVCRVLAFAPMMKDTPQKDKTVSRMHTQLPRGKESDGCWTWTELEENVKPDKFVSLALIAWYRVEEAIGWITC
jgi:hypothetical protein